MGMEGWGLPGWSVSGRGDGREKFLIGKILKLIAIAARSTKFVDSGIRKILESVFKNLPIESAHLEAILDFEF